MQLLDGFRTQLTRQAAHRFVVGNLAATDAREFPVHQVGAHFTRDIFVTPTAHVLQQQHPQNHFGWRSRASTGFALFEALAQFLLNNLQQLIVIHRLVGMAHPGFPKILDLLGDQAIGEVALKTACGDQALRSFDSSLSRRNRY